MTLLFLIISQRCVSDVNFMAYAVFGMDCESSAKLCDSATVRRQHSPNKHAVILQQEAGPGAEASVCFDFRDGIHFFRTVKINFPAARFMFSF